MITMDELLCGNDPKDIPKEHLENLNTLFEKMNKVRDKYGIPMSVSSGYRSVAHNASISNSAKNSAHCLGMACDVGDKDGNIMKFVLNNLGLMQELGMFIEDFRWTRSAAKGYWVHFGIRKASKRIFIPSSAPPEDKDCWDGIYDKKYDS